MSVILIHKGLVICCRYSQIKYTDDPTKQLYMKANTQIKF